MLNEAVYKWLDKKGYADRITEHQETIDTVEHAAQQIGCLGGEIAKTLSFIVDDKPVIVVMAGDGRVNSSFTVPDPKVRMLDDSWITLFVNAIKYFVENIERRSDFQEFI